jgi:hypothetical protein
MGVTRSNFVKPGDFFCPIAEQMRASDSIKAWRRQAMF